MDAPRHGQHPVELILLRQLAARLAFPVLLVDRQRTVVYRNPSADALFGFAAGEVPDEVALPDFVARYRPVDEDGRPVPTDLVPVSVALRERKPCQARLSIHDQHGAAHTVIATALPVEGQGGVDLGAVSIFWKTA